MHDAVIVEVISARKIPLHFGILSELHSDHCRKFESEVFKEMMRFLSFQKTHTTPLHHESNDDVERRDQIELRLSILLNIFQLIIEIGIKRFFGFNWTGVLQNMKLLSTR